MVKQRGGYYPSLMAGLLTNGPMLMAPVIASGFRLIRDSDERLLSRKNKLRLSKSGISKSGISKRGRRKTKTRRSKRTRNATKNTRKA
jgi:hypothetical protein